MSYAYEQFKCNKGVGGIFFNHGRILYRIVVLHPFGAVA